jgi:oxygen-independent coproporphyrinogen-3 oxidase
VRPTSAYVHVPFCRRICPYCDFSVLIEKRGQRKAYLERLRREIEEEPAEAGPLQTVYFGGGTPSELTSEEIGSILAALRLRFGLAPGAEVSLEANPEGVDEPGLEVLLRAGVTRLSLGIQSFDDEALRWLGRLHRGEQARRAVRLARAAGFDTFSVDLIHGVPCLDLGRSLRSIELALELAAPHLSHYGLTYHEQTVLGRRLAAGRLRPMDQELEADIYEGAAALLQAAGWEHYEISNFARSPTDRCRHNLACWHGEPYLAFGPSGVGFAGGRRWRNPASLGAWLAGAPREPEPVDERQAALESVIAGLRLVQEGLDRPAFARRHGRDVAELFPAAVQRGLELRLLELRAERMRLADLRAVLLYDSVLGLFIEEGVRERRTRGCGPNPRTRETEASGANGRERRERTQQAARGPNASRSEPMETWTLDAGP